VGELIQELKQYPDEVLVCVNPGLSGLDEYDFQLTAADLDNEDEARVVIW
jgi:hypothetical protein